MKKKINPKIIEILEINSLNISDSVTYLLSLFYEYEPTFIPDSLKQKVNTLNIVTYDRANYIYLWHLPLFYEEEARLDWVITEYLPIFKPFNKDNKFKRECTTRMEAFLCEFPEVSKELVLQATELYVQTCLQERRLAKYVTNPHYFIQKDKGVNKTNPILTYVDLVKEDKKSFTGRQSPSITMK